MKENVNHIQASLSVHLVSISEYYHRANPVYCVCTVLRKMLFWLLLYSTILRSRVDSLPSHVILHEWITFYSAFLNIHQSGVLTALALLVPHETAAVSAQVLCTPYNHAPCHFMQSHIRTVYVCLAVTCHLHFWQNDWGATAVTRGWNWYQDNSQLRKLTMKKKILWPLLQGFEPVTFQSRVQHSLSYHRSQCTYYVLVSVLFVQT